MKPSRYFGGGIGAQTFTPPAPTDTSCPPGYHWEDDATAIRGLSACVPDKVANLRIPPRVAIMPTATAPQPSVTMTTYPAPDGSGGDAAPAPSSSAPTVQQSITCPEPWSLWWLLLAAGVGAVGGTYAAKQQKKKKR